MCLETIHYFEGINVTFLEIIHQYHALYFQKLAQCAPLSGYEQNTQTVDLGGLDLDKTIIPCIVFSEAGSVRASQWLRREHAADMDSHLTGPGCLIE